MSALQARPTHNAPARVSQHRSNVRPWRWLGGVSRAGALQVHRAAAELHGTATEGKQASEEPEEGNDDDELIDDVDDELVAGPIKVCCSVHGM